MRTPALFIGVYLKILFTEPQEHITDLKSTQASRTLTYILPFSSPCTIEEKGKLGAYAMERVAAGAHLGFLSLRNAKTIEPTTGLQFLPLMHAPNTRFYC